MSTPRILSLIARLCALPVVMMVLLATLVPGARAGTTATATRVPTLTAMSPATATRVPSPTAPPTPAFLSARVWPAADARAVSVGSPVSIAFDRAMDRRSVESAFAIQPPVDGDLTWSADGSALTFTAYDELPRNTVITVTLAAGARALDSAPLPAGPLTWSFTTGDSGRSLGFGWGPYVQVLDPDGSRRIEFVSKDAPRVRVRLYALPVADFVSLYNASFDKAHEWDESVDLDVTGLAQVREFSVSVPQGSGGKSYWGDRGTLDIPGDVPGGLYVLKISAFNATSVEMFLILSHNTLVLKGAAASVTAWLSGIAERAPVSGAAVRVFGKDGALLAAGSTDGQGVLRAPLAAGDPTLAFAESGGDIAVGGLTSDWQDYHYYWWSPETAAERKWDAYLYTDRPIYRPGQTVYAKAALRADDDALLSTPDGITATLRLRDARDYVIGSQELRSNAFGTLWAEFPIADGGTLGMYHLELAVNGATFRQELKVEEYRKPEVEVSVHTDKSGYAQGDVISVTLQARYLFGQPAAGQTVTLRRFAQGSDVYDPASDEYTRAWVDLDGAGGGRTGRTDADGRWSATLPAPFPDMAYGYYRDDLFSQIIMLEATVGDERPVSSHAPVSVYRAVYGLTLTPQQHSVKPGETVTSTVYARGIDGRPLKGAVVTVGLYGWSSAHYAMDALVVQSKATTGADGSAVVGLPVSRQGWFELRADSTDAEGRAVSNHTWLWVYDAAAGGDWWWGGSAGQLRVTLDKAAYRAGETAQLLVESPVKGSALVTLERGSVRDVYVVELTGVTTLVALPVKADYSPNVYATVSVYQPISRDDERLEWQSSRAAELLRAQVNLLVPAEDRRLQLSVTADHGSVRPGQEVELSVQANGADGAPVVAEVSVAVVDEAIYLLSADLSGKLYDAFYFNREDRVETYDSLHPYRYLPGDQGGGGGGGDGWEAGQLRADFPDTAYWQPAVLTAADGHAVVRVRMPDSLTRWRVLVKAISADGRPQVGEAGTSVTVTQPIMVRPQLPRTLVHGDALTLSAVVSNYTGGSETITVWAVLRGLQHSGDAITQTLTLQPGASAVVGWPVLADKYGTAVVRVYARAKGGRDAVELSLPVEPRAVPDTLSQSGQVTAVSEIHVQMPRGVLTDASTLEIRLAPTVASGLLDGLEYLTGYPYGCVEQTMSRALPNAAVSRAFKQAGFGERALSGDLPRLVNAGLQRLYGYQHSDGGWGWWYDDDSDAYQTAYVLYGLAITRQAGYEVDATAMRRGAEWLNTRVKLVDAHTRAYALFALAVAGQGDLAATQAAASAGDANLFGQAGLAMALDTLGDHAGALRLLDALDARVTLEGETAYWQTGESDGHYHEKFMASDVRTTALVLDALVRLRPDDPLVPQVVRWLMLHRTDTGWGTTQETSYAVIALSDYLVAGAGQGGEVSYAVSVNGRQIADGAFTSGDSVAEPRAIVVKAADLLEGDNVVSIRRSGGGKLYYVAATRVLVEQPYIAAGGAIGVTRSYLDASGKRALTGAVRPGDVLTVRVEVRVPVESWYVMVEDRLPGGFEAVNEALSTSRYTGGEDDGGRTWRVLGYNRKEIRDERVDFFITHLDKGTYVYTYRIQAIQAGRFYALPAQVALMYDLNTWGRSLSTTVVVGDAWTPQNLIPRAREIDSR